MERSNTDSADEESLDDHLPKYQGSALPGTRGGSSQTVAAPILVLMRGDGSASPTPPGPRLVEFPVRRPLTLYLPMSPGIVSGRFSLRRERQFPGSESAPAGADQTCRSVWA